MTVAAIRPSSDVSAAWYSPIGATHYNVLDDVITYPSLGGTSDWIANEGYISSDNLIDDFHFGDLTDVDEVTAITIYSIGNIFKFGATSYFPELQYSINGGSSWSAVHDCTGHGIGTPPSTYVWAYDVWTISSLSWTQSEINAIRVRAISDVPNGDKDGSDANLIAAIYISVTYTPVSSGPSGIAKINGVAIANITKFNGVAIGNITKFNGIT